MSNTLFPDSLGKAKIYTIRGQQVMLDINAAVLYQVPLNSLRRTVTRHQKRFPPDFQFRLTAEEWAELKRQQPAYLFQDEKIMPTAFTLSGLLMLSSVLKSKRAVEISIQLINFLFDDNPG